MQNIFRQQTSVAPAALFARLMLALALAFAFVPCAPAAASGSTGDADDAAADGAASAFEFVYISEDEVALGETLDVAIGFADTGDAKTSTLYYQREGGELASAAPVRTAENAALYEITFTDESQLGTYSLISASWEGSNPGQAAIPAQTDDGGSFVVIAEKATCETSEDSDDADADAAEDGVVAYTLADDGTLVEAASVEEAVETAAQAQSTASIAGVEEGSDAEAKTAAADGNMVIALDPGHGGSDSGATGNGLKEKDLNLKIAKYCQTELELYSGVTTVLTRSDDTYVSLGDRVKIAAAANADVFVSFHINETSGATGFEVWVQNDSTWRTYLHEESEELGESILDQLEKLGLANRGTKERDSSSVDYEDGSSADGLRVLRSSRIHDIPAVLIEHGFIDGKSSDVALLSSESGLASMGKADAQGIVNYYGLDLKSQAADTDTTDTGTTSTSTSAATDDTTDSDSSPHYYYDADGNMLKGFQSIDGQTYYFKSDTGTQLFGWQKIYGYYYYFKSDTGALLKGLQHIYGVIYYLDPDTGKRLSGWHELGGQTFYFKSDTGALLFGWQRIYGEYYYFKSDNGVRLDGLQKIYGEYYLLEEGTGKRLTGWREIVLPNSSEDGKTGLCYFKSDTGVMLHGLKRIYGEVYYLDPDTGERTCGWQEVYDYLRYFDPSTGTRATGLTKIDGKYYYFDDYTGIIKTGWQEIGGSKYYFDDDTNEMFTGWHKISGRYYCFDDDGKLIEGIGTIMGESQTTVSQMVAHYRNHVGESSYPSSVYSSKGASTITEFCTILMEEAEAEGVKAEALYVQIVIETNYLRFGGDVDVSQCNFGGLGATGGGEPGLTFENVRQGLRAQVQHLKAYGSVEELNNECVDPRFNLVTRGCAPTLYDLSGKWAASSTYGDDLMEALKSLLST